MTSLTDGLERTKRAREHFENFIQNPQLLGPDFQPVCRLADHTPVGWQVVGRGVENSELGDRESFLKTVVTLGLAERLDWSFRCRVFDVATEAGLKDPIHLKVALAAYGTVPPPRLAVAFGRARSLKVVAEVHESALDDPSKLATGLEEFRRWGWDLAVGDLSDRTDSGSILQKVKPTVARVDLSKPGRGTSDNVKRYVETAQRLGISVLATGLDSPLRTNEAEQLGADLGLGNALGKPGPLPA